MLPVVKELRNLKLTTAIPGAATCYFGVWNWKTFGRAGSKILMTDRKNDCFFWKYQEDLLLPAAEKLQEREERYRREHRDMFWTRISISIAGAALLLNLAFQVFLYWPDIKDRWTKTETITEVQESDSPTSAR